jgi:hypothetical protein
VDRKDLPELADSLTGAADIRYCLLSDQQFERAKSYPGAIVLSSSLVDGKEVAIAFGPRHEWPEEFSRFPDWFAEAEKLREEAENITEEKWLGWDTRPIDLANFALPRASERKIRLFAVACCDLVADKMVDPRSRQAVEMALRHADGTATDEELSAAFDAAYKASVSIVGKGIRERGLPDQTSAESGAAALACSAVQLLDRTPTGDKPDGWLSLCAGGTVSDFLIWHTMQAATGDPFIFVKVTGLMRDICGNPFRRVVADPEWHTPGPKSLARDIYDLKAFDRLPQIASSLEAVGCDDPSVLNHCRIPGSHARGCWVVDLVLGYEPFWV